MSLCVLYQESPPPPPHRMKRDIKQEFLLLPPPETANEKEEFEWEYGVVLPITKKSTSLRLDQLGKRGRGIPTTERSQEYHAKNPQFNYSEFSQVGAQYFDFKQRQYRIATNSNPTRAKLVRRGLIKNKEIKNPTYFLNNGLLTDEFSGLDLGTQMMHLKLPIALRHRVGFPKRGDNLELYQPRSQTTLTGRIEKIYHQPRASTGYAIVNNVIMWGKVANPEFYASFITTPGHRSKYRRRMRGGGSRRRRN